MAKDPGKGNEAKTPSDRVTNVNEVAAQFDASQFQEHGRATLAPFDWVKFGFGKGQVEIHIPEFTTAKWLDNAPSSRELSQAAKRFSKNERIEMPSMKS